jgi:hypothetical protein
MTDALDRDDEVRRTPDEDPREMMKKMMSRCADMRSHGALPCCGTRDEESETATQKASKASTDC